MEGGRIIRMNRNNGHGYMHDGSGVKRRLRGRDMGRWMSIGDEIKGGIKKRRNSVGTVNKRYADESGSKTRKKKNKDPSFPNHSTPSNRIKIMRLE